MSTLVRLSYNINLGNKKKCTNKLGLSSAKFSIKIKQQIYFFRNMSINFFPAFSEDKTFLSNSVSNLSTIPKYITIVMLWNKIFQEPTDKEM